MRLTLFATACACLLLHAGAGLAAQYESEVRVLDEVPKVEQPKNDQALIDSVENDPYALALTLRELAARAARSGDAKQAAAYLQRALDQNALSAVVQDQMRQTLGQLYQNSGEYQRVITTLAPDLRNRSDADPQLLLTVAAAYAQLNQHRQALPFIQRAVEAESDPSREMLQVYAAVLLALKRYNQAAPIVERLVRADPSDRQGWLQLAALHAQRKDFDRAAAVMELAHRQGMLETPEERRQLAGLFVKAGAPYEAGALLNRWIERDELPADAATLGMLADAWSAARETPQAIRALNRLNQVAPSSRSWLQLGRLQMEQAQWAQAEQSLTRALAEAEDIPTDQTLVALGLARYQQADIDGALRAFRQAARSGRVRRAAEQWVGFLESGRAREQALEATRELVARRGEGEVASRFSGMETREATRPGMEGVDPDLPPLTEVGALRAGTADGRIPPWTGGLTADQPGLRRVDGQPVNPYADDAVISTIRSTNYTQYGEALSEGHKEMLRRFNDYEMRVYPSRRPVVYPEPIRQASVSNRQTARLLESDSISGADLGVPFAEPQTGAEVMWNHRVRYRGRTQDFYTDEMVVFSDGDRLQTSRREHVLFVYGNPARAGEVDDSNMLLYYVGSVDNVPIVGRAMAIVHETANQTKEKRRIWISAGQTGRVRRIPPVGFDFPRPGSEGLSFVDQIDMYNGGFQRYVWKLRGRREMLVPYNSYDINSPAQRYDQLLGPGHLDQSQARYEWHRVWVVEATERAPARHKIGKRVFYVDEDSWTILMVDVYDQAGNLWQLQEGHLYFDWESQVAVSAPIVHYDFKRNAWYANRLLNEARGVVFNQGDYAPADFSPNRAPQVFR